MEELDSRRRNNFAAAGSGRNWRRRQQRLQDASRCRFDMVCSEIVDMLSLQNVMSSLMDGLVEQQLLLACEGRRPSAKSSVSCCCSV